MSDEHTTYDDLCADGTQSWLHLFDSPQSKYRTLYPWLHLTFTEFYNCDPCKAAKDWIRSKYYSLLTAWRKIEHRPDWMIWLLRNVPSSKSTLTRHQVEQIALMFTQHVLRDFLSVMKEYRYSGFQRYQDYVGFNGITTEPAPTAAQVAANIDAVLGMMACNSQDCEKYMYMRDFFASVTSNDCDYDVHGVSLSSEQRRLHRRGRNAICVLRHALRVHRKFLDAKGDITSDAVTHPQYVLTDIMDCYTCATYVTPSTDVENSDNKWYCDTIRRVVTPELSEQQPIVSTVGTHDEESE